MTIRRQAQTSFSDRIDTDMARFTYISARNELYARDYPTAKALFTQAHEYTLKTLDTRLRARCVRALGEIAVLQDDPVGAKCRFTEVKSLCDFMGISPDCLYIGWSYCHMKEEFRGWRLFREKNIL